MTQSLADAFVRARRVMCETLARINRMNQVLDIPECEICAQPLVWVSERGWLCRNCDH